MIVEEPPYDLVALFSDLDMQKLFEALIERGQEPRRRCIRSFRWRSLRDPRRDTVWREPERDLVPFLGHTPKLLIAWDHNGSGLERHEPRALESRVYDRLTKIGIGRDQVIALAIFPELETLLSPAWDRICQILSADRALSPPQPEAILAEARARAREPLLTDFASALEMHPKEIFEGLVHTLGLRRAAPLYQKIGSEVSLPNVKQHETALRLAAKLREWFPHPDAAL